MKRKFLSLFIAIVTMTILNSPTFASVTINGISYSLRTNLTATVSHKTYTGTIVIPASVSYGGQTYSVTSIDESAFKNCSGLTSVTIPNSITSIGYEAFFHCSGLTSITIPNSVISIGGYAFNGCSSLKSITIGNSVISIGEGAFSYCSGVTAVTWNAKNCSDSGGFGSQVTSFTFGNKVETIPGSCCKGMNKLTSITIPNSVTSIGQDAFRGCSGLTSITIPNSVTSIGGYAFNGCSGLTSVTLGNGVTNIGTYPFKGCSGLTSPIYNAHVFAFMPKSYSGAYTILNGIKVIASYAFDGCSGLTSITVPNSVTSIGQDAFRDCTGLTSVTWNAKNGPSCNFGNQVTSFTFGDEVENIPAALCKNMTKLTKITIPNSVTSIGQNAFSGCSSLSSITIPNSVTSIGEGAFSYCSCVAFVTWNAKNCSDSGGFGSQVISFTFGNKVETIPGSCCKGMDRLTSITIPNSVTSIGGDAFNGCSSLTFVHISDIAAWCAISFENHDANPLYYAHNLYLNDELITNLVIPNNVTSIGNYAFYNCSSLTSVTMEAETPPTLGIETLVNTNDCPIYVPCGTIDAYKTAWGITRITHSPSSACMYTISTTSANQEWGTTAGDKSALYLENVVISAVANYGYHFVKWNDNNTENPRTITITKDETYTALFAKNTYSITKSVDSERGSISGVSQAEYLDNVTLTAVSNYGYHFIQWSDGVTDNPRTFVLTQDTTFTAEFAKNTYTISTTSANPELGTTAGDKSALYLENVVISATANYGYHFVKWNDNNTENPRTISVTKDATYTATFAKNTYSITKIANSTQGSISGPSKAEYLDNVTLTVNPNYGYHFTHWSDGNTNNPRTFVLTRDTTFTAEFAIDKSGTCGKNNLLQWTFADDGTLTISGSGELTENYTFGVEAPTQMQQLVVENEVTAIGERAFYEKNTLQKLIIGSNVTSIGKYAFAGINNRQLTSLVMPAELLTIGDYAFRGNTYLESIDFNAKLQSIGAYAFKDCYRVAEMTCLALATPDLGTDALTSINSYASLCVPEECLKKYKVDPNWGRFDLCELGTTSTVTENRIVTVEPTDNTAIFTWPTENNAASYSLQITKDGVVFCTLVFNSNGQLTGIAFAPGRNGTSRTPAATMSVAGMSFTVTGLDGASKYAYRLAIADASSTQIIAYTGEFATIGYFGEVNPGGNPEGIEDIFTDEHKASKILHDGQIYILRGEKVYTLQGQEVK